MGSNYKTVARVTTVADAVSAAYSELQALRDEMREWADNMEAGNLGQTSRYEAVNECADQLDQVADDEPEVPEGLGALPVTVHDSQNRRKGRGLSRAVRCGDATGHLEAAASVLEDQEGEEAEELAQKLREAADEASAADFPGMYG